MQCPNCGASMPEGFTFCTECGTTINTQPAYEPEFTDYEDPNCIQTANDYISKAKKGMILSIIAFSLHFVSYIPLVGTAISLASLVLLIISYVTLKGARKFPEVPSGSVNSQLYSDYISAKGKAKTGKILNIIQTILICLEVVFGIVIGVVVGLIYGTTFATLLTPLMFGSY